MEVPYCYSVLVRGTTKLIHFHMRRSTDTEVGRQMRTVRHLKIQPKIRINRGSVSKTPEIRLCGHWLERLGFEEQQRVEVIGQRGMLTIKVQD